MGNSASSKISPRRMEVSGTSAVGIAHRPSRSMEYMSSTDLGRWPVDIMVSVKASVGG
jgi:hypothetical protein